MIVVHIKQIQMKSSLIQQLTLVAPSTQRRIYQKYRENNTISTSKTCRKGYQNPHSKIPRNFKALLLRSIQNFPVLTDSEQAKQLSKNCNRTIT